MISEDQISFFCYSNILENLETSQGLVISFCASSAGGDRSFYWSRLYFASICFQKILFIFHGSFFFWCSVVVIFFYSMPDFLSACSIFVCRFPCHFPTEPNRTIPIRTFSCRFLHKDHKRPKDTNGCVYLLDKNAAGGLPTFYFIYFF